MLELTAGAVMLLVVLLAAVAGAIWSPVRRTRVLRAWAAGNGWTYVGTNPALITRWRAPIFRIGRSKRVSELVTGRSHGRRTLSFRYRYTVGDGTSQSTATYHVLAMELPAHLPVLELTPEGVGAKIARALGARDLRFESEAFNRAWRVDSPDAKFAHDVLHPRLMERLLGPDLTGLSLRIEGTDLLCWTTGAPRLDLLTGRLAVLAAVVEAVPPFVWLDHGYDPART